MIPHQTQGTGEHRVIALHGWFGDRTAFAPLWPHLDESAFTYAFPDYRGYGEAKATPGEFTMAEIAGDVLSLADHLGWEHFSLVGHSMGGMAAQRVLADAPERVRALVGVSPVPATGVPFDEQTWDLFSGAVDDPANRRAIIDMTTGGTLPGRWLDAMVARSLACSTVEAFRDYLAAWVKTDFHSEIEGNTVPALAVVGGQDPALSAEVMRATWMTHYPNARLEVLADAGHYAMDEAPLTLTARVESFLTASG
ncbi:alpha/beta fold hydrolase [Allokutzneria oryzae]|uniref:Alpha/beta fold hydrolase n=1 Tax=Allokutzneria oryzae TaxID=1378989 RepID=A0ABV6A5V5_9PSEU